MEAPALLTRLVSYIWLQLRLIRRLKRHDAIYVRAHPFAGLITAFARIKGIPTFHEVNGPYEDLFIVYPAARSLRRCFEALQRWQYRHAAGLIGVTPQLANHLTRERAGATCCIPNGANVRLFHPQATRRPGLPPRYVVFFGGLTPWHGIDCMLAAAIDPAWPADVSLVIVGDGAERQRVASAAARHDRILALGRLPYAELPGVVVGALAGLVPMSDPGGRSATGLAPLKLFETLASGVPVIVSDLPGQAAFVRDHRCGLVVPADDPHALASAVASLASKPEEATELGKRGAEVVRASESWDHRAAATDVFLRRRIMEFRGG